MSASCVHFHNYLKEFGVDPFNVIHGMFSACVSQDARRQKVRFIYNYGPHLW